MRRQPYIVAPTLPSRWSKSLGVCVEQGTFALQKTDLHHAEKGPETLSPSKKSDRRTKKGGQVRIGRKSWVAGKGKSRIKQLATKWSQHLQLYRPATFLLRKSLRDAVTCDFSGSFSAMLQCSACGGKAGQTGPKCDKMPVQYE